MKVACLGGGPAGLYLGILMRRADPRHEVVVYERNRPDDTFGFGVVFSDATLGALAAADPDSHAAITHGFARWDDIEIHVGGQVLRSSGHGFCGIERKALLAILQARAREVGVDVRFEHDLKIGPGPLPAELDADVVVAADGVASAFRTTRADALGADVDVRPNKFVWLGTTVPYRAFTFIFKNTPHGLFRVHAYRFSQAGSTFIVECTAQTWARAGLEGAGEDETVAILERIFASELAGHRLIKNRSIWRNFPTVRCARWCDGNTVLVGDAAHTAHFSIGSGTKLAMEDAIALAEALAALPVGPERPSPAAVTEALTAYERKRRPEVESLQSAAQASLEWFETAERYLGLPPAQFAYHLMTRSLRVSHASMLRRDPPLADAVETLVAARAGVSLDGVRSRRPIDQPLPLGPVTLARRLVTLVHAPGHPVGGVVGDDHLVAIGAAAQRGAGLIVTEPMPTDSGDGSGAGARLHRDEHGVAWQRVVDYVHFRSDARIAARLVSGPHLLDAVARARHAGFDALVLELGPADEVPALLARVGTVWPADRALVIALAAADGARSIARAGQLAGRDVACLIEGGPGVRPAQVVMVADTIRNQHGVLTLAALGPTVDADAAIAAGRVDAVVEGPGPVEATTSAGPRPRS
ncbi:MAG: FAD-dependent monooxygenase [Kofleriaceae bacterium]|nr:FAD-dependent monooxygenase [Kofleriaceae bacterium]